MKQLLTKQILIISLVCIVILVCCIILFIGNNSSESLSCAGGNCGKNYQNIFTSECSPKIYPEYKHPWYMKPVIYCPKIGPEVLSMEEIKEECRIICNTKSIEFYCSLDIREMFSPYAAKSFFCDQIYNCKNITSEICESFRREN